MATHMDQLHVARSALCRKAVKRARPCSARCFLYVSEFRPEVVARALGLDTTLHICRPSRSSLHISTELGLMLPPPTAELRITTSCQTSNLDRNPPTSWRALLGPVLRSAAEGGRIVRPGLASVFVGGGSRRAAARSVVLEAFDSVFPPPLQLSCRSTSAAVELAGRPRPLSPPLGATGGRPVPRLWRSDRCRAFGP